MRYVPRALLAGLSGVAVSLLAACGSSGSLLSADQGSTLNAQLNSVSAALSARNCAAALGAAGQLQNSASSLSGVDPALGNAVAQGASTVLADTQQRCPAHTTSTPTTTATTTSTPSTTTTTTQATTTQATTPTTAPTTTATTPAPTTTTPPPATTPTGPGTTSTGSGGVGIGGSGGSGSGGGSGNGGSGGGGGY
jgi:hypothetical protein